MKKDNLPVDMQLCYELIHTLDNKRVHSLMFHYRENAENKLETIFQREQKYARICGKVNDIKYSKPYRLRINRIDGHELRYYIREVQYNANDRERFSDFLLN